MPFVNRSRASSCMLWLLRCTVGHLHATQVAVPGSDRACLIDRYFAMERRP
jgi:hypothetical protein